MYTYLQKNPHIHTYTHTCVCSQLLCCVRLFLTLWTIACQAPLSMGFSRQEYWNRLPFPLTQEWILCLLRL